MYLKKPINQIALPTMQDIVMMLSSCKCYLFQKMVIQNQI